MYLHKSLGAKMVAFAGWQMPLQYPAGILAEHHAVRTGRHLRRSHMGEIDFTGPDRHAAVHRVTTNDAAELERRRPVHLPCYPEGAFVDDCTVYRRDDDYDRRQRHEHRQGLCHTSGEHAGHRPTRTTRRHRAAGGAGPERRASTRRRPAAGRPQSTASPPAPSPGRISPPAPATPAKTASSCTAATPTPPGVGRAHRRRRAPIGLGARDTLRLETRHSLYGNEIDHTTTPLEAGLGWVVKLDKGARFAGDEALPAQKQRGVTRKLVGFQLEDRDFPRHGYTTHHLRPGSRHRPQRHPEPQRRRGHRHDLPARRGRQARHEIRGRLPRREVAGGSGEVAILEERECEEMTERTERTEKTGIEGGWRGWEDGEVRLCLPSPSVPPLRPLSVLSVLSVFSVVSVLSVS